MEVLHLTLKKKWFDMILYGDKREEYREIKPYWKKRLERIYTKKTYTHVKFTNGYGENRPCFVIELKTIDVGFGKKHWGAPRKSEPFVFILKLGEVLATN